LLYRISRARARAKLNLYSRWKFSIANKEGGLLGSASLFDFSAGAKMTYVAPRIER
jgi:hypothetical protein